MNDPWGTLNALLSHLWDRLDDGAARADSPFRFVTFATQGAEGPEARIVGLRRADRSLGEVEIHSDLRTAKVAALRGDPRAALLFWDPVAQVQLRLQVDARILEAEPERWARVPTGSRGNYGTDPAPGKSLDHPEALIRTSDVSRFCAVIGQVRRMDCVSLAHSPHRRAVFDRTTPSGRWVAP